MLNLTQHGLRSDLVSNQSLNPRLTGLGIGPGDFNLTNQIPIIEPGNDRPFGNHVALID